MLCLKLTLAYTGTAYSGWQIQEKKNPPPTIQGELERALGSICKQHVRVFGAGRTDAGVHALAQVAHCKVPDLPAINWLLALNTCLPPDIRVLAARPTHEGFHACFDAQSKTYRYELWLSRLVPPRLYPFVWGCGPLDLAALEAALPLLEGRHDFASLQNKGSDLDNTVRTVYSLTCKLAAAGRDSLQKQDLLLELHVRANGFLKQMVRNMVGLLVAVGRHKFDAAHIPALLAACARHQAPPTAPARGLTLLEVHYDEQENTQTGQSHLL